MELEIKPKDLEFKLSDVFVHILAHRKEKGKTDGGRKQEKHHMWYVQSGTSTVKNNGWDVIVATEVGPRQPAAYLLNSGETTFSHFASFCHDRKPSAE